MFNCSHCQFIANLAKKGNGGGISLAYYSIFQLSEYSRFINNQALFFGGAISIDQNSIYTQGNNW